MSQLRLLVVGLVLALLAACNQVGSESDAGSGTDGAQDEIAQFHANRAKGDLDAVWDSTAPQLKDIIERDRWDRMLTDFADLLGPVESTARESISTNSADGVTSTEIIMRTQFAKAEGLETFVYRSEGGRLLLTDYIVQSPALNDYDWSRISGDGVVYEEAPE